MTRYYSLDRTMVEAANDQEHVRAGLIAGLIDQGASPELLEGAKRAVHRRGMDRAPSAENIGAQAHQGVLGGDNVYIDESHRNSAGDVVTTVLRRNGPHIERVKVREQQVAEHSYAVTEHFGRRSYGR